MANLKHINSTHTASQVIRRVTVSLPQCSQYPDVGEKQQQAGSLPIYYHSVTLDIQASPFSFFKRNVYT
jgi:hypothetical protein